MGKKHTEQWECKHDIKKSTYENIPYIEHFCFHTEEGGGK